MPTITIKNSILHYLDQGEGFPIIFGHSYFWDANMWAPQLAVLSKDYRCISLDLWDHGQSGHVPASIYSIEQIAEDVWQFMQVLNIKECALVGLSVGGMWIPHLTLAHPQAVKGLVMMDTFVGAEPLATQQEYLGLVETLSSLGKITPEFADGIIPYFFSPETFANKPEIVGAFREDLIARDPSKVPGICTLGKAIFTRTDILDRLAQITQPTLIMVGEDDGPRPLSEAKQMAERLPNAQLEIIKDAGHIANLENSEFTTAKLQQFLAKLAV